MKKAAAMMAPLLLLTACYDSADEYRDLAARHVQTEGRVVFLTCSNHGTFIYSYTVNGIPYGDRTDTSALGHDKRCEDLRRNDRVRVYYDPQRPAVHSLREPDEEYRRRHGFSPPGWIILFGPFLYPVGMWVSDLWKGRKKS
ncbi:hypothetical protein [Duganella sp. FT27W]|uniref:DUF3592 domain-containing protein n=1 Tax=Duganella sp. FT27W TaxID=2654636 RepID=UPI00128C8D1D|nr:hypothetical protein [Duganella sp. FT27W]MPQ58452.1 hypothetical protein [Duganella sp. FT27W]